MFEVGFTEILLIFGIALLVLGPERLPKLAADVGRWAGRARSMARQLRTQLEQEVQFDPLQDPVVSQPAASNTVYKWSMDFKRILCPKQQRRRRCSRAAWVSGGRMHAMIFFAR